MKISRYGWALGMLTVLATLAVPTPASSVTLREHRIPAPALALDDVFGRRHDLEALRGKVVLVNFWATWCPPCLAEMPSLQRAWERLRGEDFRVLAVAMGDDTASVNAFYHRLPEPLTFTLLPDPRNAVFSGWPLFGIPATFLVDRNGCIAARAEGAREWDGPEAMAAIRTLLAETPPERSLRAVARARPRGEAERECKGSPLGL